MASRGRQEALGRRVFLDHKGHRVFQGKMVLTAPMAPTALTDRTVLTVPMALTVMMVPPDLLGLQVFRDNQARKAFKVRLELLVRWDRRVLLVTLVFRAHLGALDLVGLAVRQVYPDQ